MQVVKARGVFADWASPDRAPVRSGVSPKLALEPGARDANIEDMGMRLSVAIGLAWTLAMSGRVYAQSPTGAQSPTEKKADNPDAAPPLLESPRNAPPAQPAGEVPGPPPRALDSKRTPMPDRLQLDHWGQYYPQAPPTPPIPDSGGASGGGAKRVNTIIKKAATGGAPPDLPRDSVTRTPEDQLAPPSPPATQSP